MRSKKSEKSEFEKMNSRNIAKPTQTKWAAAVVSVPKKGETSRFCVDYRTTNTVIEGASNPVPRIDKCVNSLRDTIFFSTHEAESCYRQAKLDIIDHDEKALLSHRGLWCNIHMSVRLRNSPDIFPKSMNVRLSVFRWSFALTYSDVIVMFSESRIKRIAQKLRSLFVL